MLSPSHRAACFFLMISAAGGLSAQTAPPAGEFEAASIKRSGPGSHFDIQVSAGMLTMSAVTLKDCIKAGYRVKGYQISGGPAWINSDRYDIVAKAAGNAGPQELAAMLQKLLADRFQLSVRREAQTGPLYTLTIDKTGSKLRPAPQEANYQVSRSRIAGKGMSISKLAELLSDAVERPVIDKTGLAGLYEVALTWTPEPNGLPAETQWIESSTRADGPPIYVAVSEQLGFKLTAGRGPVDVLVIQHAEKASEN